MAARRLFSLTMHSIKENPMCMPTESFADMFGETPVEKAEARLRNATAKLEDATRDFEYAERYLIRQKEIVTVALAELTAAKAAEKSRQAVFG